MPGERVADVCVSARQKRRQVLLQMRKPWGRTRERTLTREAKGCGASEKKKSERTPRRRRTFHAAVVAKRSSLQGVGRQARDVDGAQQLREVAGRHCCAQGAKLEIILKG